MMKRQRAQTASLAILLCTIWFAGRASAQSPEPQVTPAAAATDIDFAGLFGTPTGDVPLWLADYQRANPDWDVEIVGTTVTLHRYGVPLTGDVKIPALATPVLAIEGLFDGEACPVTLTPLPSQWQLAWKPTNLDDSYEHNLFITLRCATLPVTPDQLPPVSESFDGMLAMPAARAVPAGETLRYEPAPHKNVLGYWTKTDNVARWRVKIDRPGRFALAMLIGVGEGQGGSRVEASLHSGAPESNAVWSKSLTTESTGHFQNFRWQPVDVLEIPQAGEYVLQIAAPEIAANAALDIREVQLVRQAR